jgi:hypothetical protein
MHDLEEIPSRGLGVNLLGLKIATMKYGLEDEILTFPLIRWSKDFPGLSNLRSAFTLPRIPLGGRSVLNKKRPLSGGLAFSIGRLIVLRSPLAVPSRKPGPNI